MSVPAEEMKFIQVSVAMSPDRIIVSPNPLPVHSSPSSQARTPPPSSVSSTSTSLLQFRFVASVWDEIEAEVEKGEVESDACFAGSVQEATQWVARQVKASAATVFTCLSVEEWRDIEEDMMAAYDRTLSPPVRTHLSVVESSADVTVGVTVGVSVGLGESDSESVGKRARGGEGVSTSVSVVGDAVDAGKVVEVAISNVVACTSSPVSSSSSSMQGCEVDTSSSSLSATTL